MSVFCHNPVSIPQHLVSVQQYFVSYPRKSVRTCTYSYSVLSVLNHEYSSVSSQYSHNILPVALSLPLVFFYLGALPASNIRPVISIHTAFLRINVLFAVNTPPNKYPSLLRAKIAFSEIFGRWCNKSPPPCQWTKMSIF